MNEEKLQNAIDEELEKFVNNFKDMIKTFPNMFKPNHNLRDVIYDNGGNGKKCKPKNKKKIVIEVT